jgi:uncharacterized membrane protein
MPMTTAASAAFPLKAPRWLDALGWRTLAGALLTAGIVHILATLAVPLLGSGSAFAKLRADLPVNRMVVWTPSAPGKEALPFLMPDALFAVCRFDLSRDSLNVTATLVHAGWVLSLHTAMGENFYAMPAQPLNHAEVSLTVVPGGDKSEFVPQPRRPGLADASVASPTSAGLVIVRAPLKGVAWRQETEAILRRASCAPVAR